MQFKKEGPAGTPKQLGWCGYFGKIRNGRIVP
jgi:hypothetical protein